MGNTSSNKNNTTRPELKRKKSNLSSDLATLYLSTTDSSNHGHNKHCHDHDNSGSHSHDCGSHSHHDYSSHD